jgi:hypothetical protein
MVAEDSTGSEARRAEVLAALSISIDLALGLPMEHVLRSSLLASMLADELDFSEEQRATVYYTNLVLWIGCHADSHEFSRWFGDDLAMRRDSYQLDWSGLSYMRFLLQRAGSHQPVLRRTQLLFTLMLAPRAQMAALIHSHCLSAGLMAQRGVSIARSQRLSSAPSSGGTAPDFRGVAAVRRSHWRPGSSSWPRPARCTYERRVSRVRSR